MASAAVGSTYEVLKLIKNGREIALFGKTTQFDYYESLLSPCITARMTFMDSGDAIVSDGSVDRQERLGSIYNALPITSEEQVAFKISSSLGTLDFTKNPLRVNGAVNFSEPTRESVVLDLISENGLRNSSIPVPGHFEGRISDSVTKILKTSFGLPDEKIFTDVTKYSYEFDGNCDPPFENILDLASKSCPEKGDPGFFFYETQRGMCFKSISGLIDVDPENIPVYHYSGGMRSSADSDINDNKIIAFNTSKNQNLINAAKAGCFVTRNLYLNPLTLETHEVIFRASENKLDSTLGKNIPDTESFDNYSRTFYNILDIGFHSVGVDFNPNNDPRTYQAKSAMRFNTLMSQVYNIEIPFNPNLSAGDVIRCEIEKITLSEKEQGGFDQNQSGNYLILHLRHHFESNKSRSFLTLVRDSYGIYTSKR